MVAAAGSSVAELVGAGWMEAHPDGEVFFADDVDGEQDAAEVFAEVFGPVLANEVQLAGEGVGRGEKRGAQSVDEGSGVELRAGDEVVGESGGDFFVDGLLLETGVVEEIVEGREGGIDVGEPEEHELFKGGFAVGEIFGGALEPVGGGDFSAIDGGVGELLGEGEQEPIELDGAGLGGEEAHGVGEDGRVDFLAVAGDECVVELVDKAHGEESAGVDGLGGIGIGAAGGVHLLRELTAGGYVGEDDVAGVAEEQVVEFELVAKRARDVKFHAESLRAKCPVRRSGAALVELWAAVGDYEVPG